MEPFIVLISNTFKKAAMYLDAIKMTLVRYLLQRRWFGLARLLYVFVTLLSLAPGYLRGKLKGGRT